MNLDQQSIAKRVNVVDGVNIKEVRDLCQQMGLGYEVLNHNQKDSILKRRTTSFSSNLSTGDTLVILILLQNTYSPQQLQQFKHHIDFGRLLTVLVKSNMVPIPPEISPFISHTCERSAISLYLSTLVKKYYHPESLLKQSSLLTSNGKSINKSQVEYHSKINENQTSIQQYISPHYSGISGVSGVSGRSANDGGQKQIILKQADIKVGDENPHETIIFKEWLDLVRLYESNKQFVKQIKVVKGVWYENMLGSFKSEITKYPPSTKIEMKSSITQVDTNHYQQVHIFYEQTLQPSLLQHILHACQQVPNMIPHNLESPYEIRNSMLNQQDFIYAFLTPNLCKAHFGDTQSKGSNYLINHSPSSIHQILASISNPNYPTQPNVLSKLLDLEYQRMLQCVSETTLHSQLLSSLSISRASSVNKQTDLIQQIHDIKKEDTLYILIPQQFLHELTQYIGHLKRVHLMGYESDNLQKQLLRRKKSNLKSLVIASEQTLLIENCLFQYPSNIYIGHQSIAHNYPKLQLVFKSFPKLVSLLQLCCSTKKVEQYSLNISRSSMSSEPIILFYKYPDDYSLKQLISTHCNRSIDLHAYSTPQSLLLNLKTIQSNDGYGGSFIIIVLKDHDITTIQPQLQSHHKVIRLFSRELVAGRESMKVTDNVLVETMKYEGVLNYLKGEYVEEEIMKERFRQEKTVRVGVESSESNESAITLGRHSSYHSNNSNK